MSNYLAIATVTASLKSIIEKTIKTGAKNTLEVTTVRPTPEGKGLPELGVNVFLYQITRNKRSSNYDNRTRKVGGKLIKRTSTGVDLHYVLTFHGDEKLLAHHKLAAKVMGTLSDHPILTPDMITSAIAASTDEELASSDLADQPEPINIIQLALETDELAKICPMVVQPPYAPYLAYQITVVMIDGAEPGELPLRVRDRRVYVAPDRPTISWVMPETGIKQPILADSTLLIRGNRLKHEQTRVQLGSHRLVPQEVTETEVSLSLKEVDASLLRAGVNSLQIVHLIATDKQPEPDHILQSNALPFVLCPEIVGEVNVSQLEPSGKKGFAADITVELELLVSANQQVVLLLNEVPNQPPTDSPAAYMFKAKPRETDTHSVVFPIRDVKGGEYFVRVQVDSAESLLKVDTDRESLTFDRYIGPKVAIA